LGDVCKINGFDLANEIDLVVFGSPCTNLTSINPVDRRGLEGTESSLFYEAIRILSEIISKRSPTKPLLFQMENVASMRNSDRDKITQTLNYLFTDTQLLSIDSALVSGAHRRRYYWSNIANQTIPEPVDISFQDILVNGFTEKKKANVLLSGNNTLTNGIFRHYKMGTGNIIFKDKAFADLPTEQKLSQYPAILKASGYKGKPKCISDEYDFPNGCYRHPSIKELELLMTMPEGYISDVPKVSKSNKQKAIGLAMTVDVIAHLFAPLCDVYGY
jgi:site-specific DNA-cytosine methylase